ncbi:MAG: hypothetical protein PWP23_982 [Candidatus Sumerlaeota bacterium]|nr:hypothetical protein [Candidatus Sumerlaeota bacterium]
MQRMLPRTGRPALSLALAAMFAIGCYAQESRPMKKHEEAEIAPGEVINTQEIRRGVPMGGRDGKSRTQIAYEQIIAKVEPDLQGDPDRLSAYIANFYHECVSDTRLFAVKLDAQWQDGTVVLTGHAEFPQIREALEMYFEYLKFEKIDNRVELLPADALGAKKYALVTTANAKSYDNPGEHRETMTQDFVGDVVYLLKEAENGYYLCHSSEGYVGYIDGAALKRVDAAELAAYKKGAQATFRRLFKGEDLLIPAGAVLPVRKETKETISVELPDGRLVAVPAGLVSVRPEGSLPVESVEAIQTAREMLGTPYLWGGKNTEGVDCSGLVQASFRSQGVSLARDAFQQALSGRLVGTRWHMDLMQPGDLVYFLGSRGKISHTGIYLGGMEYIEAASPGVKITSMDPKAENFEKHRLDTFCFAKRVVE